MKRTRIGAGVVLAAAAMLLAACGSGPARGSGTTAAPSPPPSATDSPAGHGLHGSSTPAPAAPLREGERFVTAKMPAAYTPVPPNGGTDVYRCFLVDPGLGEADAFLTGTQFTAQNTDVVHHAILFQVGPGQIAQVRETDAKDPGEGWTCFGDSGIGEAAWIGHWAPGADEVLLDPKLGYSMPKGSALVMQVHYSTLALDGKPAGSDQSSVRLRVSSDARTPLMTTLFAAPIELPCTGREKGPLCERGAAVADVGKRFGDESATEVGNLLQACSGGKARPGPTQHCDVRSPGTFTLHALAGHMHLLGRAIKVELNPGKAKAQTLLEVPDYNFDNQALQPLPKPVTVKKGDTIRVTCTHDASLRAQLPLLRNLPPRYVVWGEGTQDEMCLGIGVASAAS
ncbi:monooxygenase [Nonomuraea typhae]|uniref:monooxygenase n=1 Tax=Nonomuraea typhae TaxID=2603600 RepID=UPI001FE8AD92|nr:monooxygenase [Nonomuraea typhae]